LQSAGVEDGYDVAHEYSTVPNVLPRLREAVGSVAEFHILDAPGRREPGTGKIDIAAVYKAIRESGFRGFITFEYEPLGDQRVVLMNAAKTLRAAFGA
jgi:hydroxypyruvate isomerase